MSGVFVFGAKARTPDTNEFGLRGFGAKSRTPNKCLPWGVGLRGFGTKSRTPAPYPRSPGAKPRTPAPKVRTPAPNPRSPSAEPRPQRQKCEPQPPIFEAQAWILEPQPQNREPQPRKPCKIALWMPPGGFVRLGLKMGQNGPRDFSWEYFLSSTHNGSRWLSGGLLGLCF